MNNNIELVVDVINEDIFAVNVNISVAVNTVDSSGRSDYAANGAVETGGSNDVTISNVEGSERFGGGEGKRLSRIIGSVDVKSVGLIGIKSNAAVVKVSNTGDFVFIGGKGEAAVGGVVGDKGLRLLIGTDELIVGRSALVANDADMSGRAPRGEVPPLTAL